MFRQLASHNADVGALVEKGYAVGFDSGYLIVRDVPYLDESQELRIGALVSTLDFIDANHVRQVDHQVLFAGSVPHGLNGMPIPNLGGGPTDLQLSDASPDVVVERSFSNKPLSGAYGDLFEKIDSYVAQISGPAIELRGASPLTFRSVDEMPSDSVFKFQDTVTSRAGIGDLAARLKDDTIAIVGLGGTGSYVLDYVAKTPVREIRLFDHDDYHVHNAFRSPGALNSSDLGLKKVTVFESRYSNFRAGLTPHVCRLDETTASLIEGVTFAFVCVDKAPARAAIVDLLVARSVPFIDVGMGLHRRGNALTGQMRTTLVSAEECDRVRAMGWIPLAEDPDDEYAKNIQIAELNALNAAFAVVMYKQLRGFYAAEPSVQNVVFDICDLKSVGEALPSDL